MKPAKTPRANAPNRSAPPANEINALVALFSSGRYADAAEQAKPLTQRLPQHPFGWKVLAAALSRMGRHADALVPMQKTVALSPTDAEAHYNLGTALNALGRHGEAERSFRQATQIAPDYAPAHCSVGNTLQSMGRLQDALASYRRATELAPDYAEAHSNLANALQALGQLDQAEASCRAALRIKPDYPQALCNLGNTLHAMGRLEEAAASYHRALQIEPAYADALSNLGNTLQALGRSEEAVASYRQALSINPALAQAHSNLANTLHSLGRLDEAEACCRNALQFKPDFAEVYSNLGNTLQAQSRLDEAIAAYRRALEIRPDFASAHSNLLFTLNYHPDMSGDDILAAYRAYERQFAQPHYASWRAHGNDRSTQRRLRVGYVSPAFQSHAVRHFLEPLLARHDPAVVEVFAYAELACDDTVTARYQRYVAHWVATRGMSDEALAARIRADAIDILVDVAGHTGGNRLQVFARKPAPVSLHWLDFGYTTGLNAIDYYLTDWASVPAGSESLFSEKPWRLDGPGLVFRPAEGMGTVNTLPATRKGHITFGSLTRAVRINHRTLHAWARILHQVRGSHLVIDSRDFRSVKAQEALAQKFVELGIDRGRLEIGCHSPPWDVLRGIDIGLDCFPHNSGTTLFEGLYLGVPFVTLAGRPSVGRLGASILQSVGLTEWIADTEENYVEVAVAMAADHVKLASLRSSLRSTMENSPLMDEAGFARRVEAAYQSMFKLWVDRVANDTALGAAETHVNRGNILRESGLLAEAASSYQKALADDPNCIEACCNLGVVLQMLGRLDEAQASYRRTLQLDPDCAPAHNNLGTILQTQGRLAEAESSLRQAVRVAPGYAEAWSNLGSTLHSLGQLTEAQSCCQRALQLRPQYAEAHNNLGNTLHALGRLGEAEVSCRTALQLNPSLAEAHNNLGNTLLVLSRLVEAAASYRTAVQRKPDYAQAHSNLAVALAYLSDFTDVVSVSDQALALKPDDEAIWEQRLYNFSYHPDLSAQDIYSEFVRWGDRFVDPVVDFSGHDRTLGRRLRIGYVSPDFRRHTSRFFFWPLFANHDPAVVELVAYSNVVLEDDVTQDFKGLFAHWRNIRGVSDQDVAELVRRDQIDILVDCCNHMRDERLGVFALKPAPIQATWLGAAWTTGLKAVDYALIDPYMAPEGTLARETIVRLPHCFVAYRPPEPTPEVAPTPCLRNGFITFGYSGRSERLNHHTFRVWGEILRQNPSARLILDFRSFVDPATQAHYRAFMARQGMDASRVTMRCSSNIFEGLKDFDILLDCFPHSGGTMLFDALWMGVPVLTLASRPPVGRIGTSLMMNLDLPQWVAHSHADYIAKALSLAQDTQALAELRSTMRERLQRSPIMDGVGFARGVEAAYRRMFVKWAAHATLH